MKIIKSKVFKLLVVFFIVGFFLGIITNIIYSDNSKIIDYFNLLKNDNPNYFNGLIISISNNYKYAFIIWIFGIIFFLSFLVQFIIVFRGISVGFTLSSIILTFKLKGLIIALIMMIPVMIINEIIFILLSYYSVHFSIKSFKAIKYNKYINIKSFTKNYFYIFLILISILFISSLFEIYITSNIIKFVL